MNSGISEKTNRVLNIIILGLILILIRVWYLAVVQHDENLEKARRPQRRSAIEKVERATIRDRFNIPLALNKIQYNAAVCYADIRHIPRFKWEKNGEGKKVRVPMRSQYIKDLAELLAKELQIDAQGIEDTIHSKASLFPHTPFILKEDLTEKEYYRLKMLEMDWVGIRTERGSKRYYPQGKIGADVVGYMGSISGSEYYAIAQEIKLLQTYLAEREAGQMPMLPKGFQNPLEVREKLKTLQEKAYTINDLVGKSGVECSFDADLRGYAGKKTYEIDTKGTILRELPGGRPSISGQRILLSISSELQEFAENLLAHNERIREARHEDGSIDWSAPWIKGGAIVAMDPHNGEILALASYPRIDPNDFVPSRIPEERAVKQTNVIKWLENESYVGEIWDGKCPMERERHDLNQKRTYIETAPLTLHSYLETILPPQSEILESMRKIRTVGQALFFQQQMEKLLELTKQDKMHVAIDALYNSGAHRPTRLNTTDEEKEIAAHLLQEHMSEVMEIRTWIDPLIGAIKYNDDKLLCLDLCRMLVFKEPFTGELAQAIGHLPLALYKELNQAAAILQHFVLTETRRSFHNIDFRKWRDEHFKEYLQLKRKEEKEKKKYARPYTDYLEQREREMFQEFWDEHRAALFASFIRHDNPEESAFPLYLEQLLSAKTEHLLIEKERELLKSHLGFLSEDQQKLVLRAMRPFAELDRPLLGRYRTLRHTNGVQMEKHLAAAFYPLTGFGYGRSQAFRQSTPHGSVFKLVPAYQGMLEKYLDLNKQVQSFDQLNPLTIVDNIKWHPKPGSNDQVLGHFLDGQVIKRYYKGGKLPRTHPNIGKIDVIGALEQSSNIYFSLLASEQLHNPLNLVEAARAFGYGEKTGIEIPGEIAGTIPDDVAYNRTGLYSFAIGQHSLVVTPLQSAVMLSAIANQGPIIKPKVIHAIAGQERLREYQDPFNRAVYPFQENLSLVGIHFPLFTATNNQNSEPLVWFNAPEIKRILPMPDCIRTPLMEGMHRVLYGARGTARPSVIRALQRNPQWMRNFMDLKGQLIGKTGTAEILFKQTIDAESLGKIQNHIWTGGIVFSKEEKQTWDNPELIIVVYLRYSEAGGKETAPLAAEMVKKWREIRSRHANH